ncbi:MAG: metallophosphoesterase [Sedimenticolaceae bacterium]
MSDLANKDRRQFLGFTGKVGLSTMVASAAGVNLGLMEIVSAQTGKRGVEPFRFAIISDSHLYSIPDHKFDQQLMDAVAQVNAMDPLPDFVVYGGDIAQNGTEDQLAKGKKILAGLKVPMKVIPGEHDWYLDMGTAWRGLFGDETWSFNHKGVHFIGLNSILVEDFWTPAGLSDRERMAAMEMLEGPIGGPWGIHAKQLEWLKKDVANVAPDTPVVVFTHSPLWDYYPRWNFQTSDAPEIRDILSKFANVMSLHGHVHQTIYNKIGNLSSVGSLSTAWPWPYPPVDLAFPESQMTRADPSIATDGMGTQMVDISATGPGIYKHVPFEESLTPWLEKGILV